MTATKKDFREALKKRIEENSKSNDGKSFVKGYLDEKKIEGIEQYKIKEDNLLDFIPYIVGTKNHSGKLEIGSIDYVLEIYTHRDIGPENKEILCLRRMYGKACPICEEMQKRRENGESNDDMKELWTRHRTLYNVIDLNEEEKGIQLFDVTFNWIEKYLRKETRGKDGEIITFVSLEDGKSVTFYGQEKTFTNDYKKKIEFKEPVALKFVDRNEQYDESILQESYSLDSLLYVPTYQEVYEMFYQVDIDENEKDVESKESLETEIQENNIKKFRKKKKESFACPHDFEIGVDFGEYEECEKCEFQKQCEEYIDL